ncbi:endonuclease MutS2 [Campylobacter sp. RM16192]|uniref:endonuclease MutS2 n=1 Tax=Campylobacter sp. RM16192 TaxID=1660080 RepID=UPI0014528D08|nr:endonuclease MutS2 [Campylobacter sp. RM16192]QCD53075.1 DNA mismatch binding protein, MutS2 family [Campylobacter sp. RM16192]
MDRLIQTLDLTEYIAKFSSFLARKKPLFIPGDTRLHYEKIIELSLMEFKEPEDTANLDDALMHLSKQAILHISEIYEFAKIIRYFTYLKTLKFEKKLGEWLAKIEIPEAVLKAANYFDKNGELKDEIDERLVGIRAAFNTKKAEIDADMKRLIYSKSITPYLVDTQVHFINNQEALLVRGGFNHALKGTVIGRSASGYFYVMPANIEKLKKEQSELIDKKEQIVYEYAKQISGVFHKNLLFLKFINTAFDLFDAYSARVLTARSLDYEFVLSDNSDKIILKNFAHPALKNPKSVNVDFSKKVLLITGVNAGGKSMLLKSIIAAAFMAKYLLPMRIDPLNSRIGGFKEFDTIIEDPQNVKNDISTFAGRMMHFAKLFTKKNLLIGIDEIELGTDFEEAASLYGVMIEKLIAQDIKMIITTHHKRLAMILAKNSEVELVAALYDEANSRPKFEFLKGTIGKSYAFETAARYGISQNLVSEAKRLYGEDKENLNEIISKTLNLEVELKQRLENTLKKEQKLDSLIDSLRDQKERFEIEQQEIVNRLEREYFKAINEAKRAINLDDTKEKQRALNRANEAKKTIVKPEVATAPELNIGDHVKYGKIKGVVINLSKNDATIQTDAVSLRVPIKMLKKSGNPPPAPKKSGVNLKVQKPSSANVVLDLHGMRADEAIDKLDKFISDSLVMGFDEISVFHGIGTGKLAYAVKNFLREHPSVKEFFDAPPNQGGFGAKIIRL